MKQSPLSRAIRYGVLEYWDILLLSLGLIVIAAGMYLTSSLPVPDTFVWLIMPFRKVNSGLAIIAIGAIMTVIAAAYFIRRFVQDGHNGAHRHGQR